MSITIVIYVQKESYLNFLNTSCHIIAFKNQEEKEDIFINLFSFDFD